MVEKLRSEINSSSTSIAAIDELEKFKKNELNELKMNNKASINFLTILAEDKVANAPQIVRAIEERILEVCIQSFLSNK